SYISLTVHWIEASRKEWVAKSCTAACEAFYGTHTATRIAAKIKSMLENLGIEDSTSCVTSDTAANMKKAIQDY
ncbi:unnamed protein product, partial [Ectocarpus sp. 12 AP-2014]